MKPLLLAAAFGLLAFPAPAPACGPDFPNSYLSNSFDEVTALPSLNFETELEHLLPPGAAVSHPAAALADPRAGELAEVRAVLGARGLSKDAVDRTTAAYDRRRPDARLPREFQLYGLGASAWAAGNLPEAVGKWKELLALPERERHFRTVWAAYMLGRAEYLSDPDAACRAFGLARDAAAHGFADSQGLSVASLGWEARSYLVRNAYRQAIGLYFRQFQLGDPSALPSLQRTVRNAFVRDEEAAAGGSAFANEADAKTIQDRVRAAPDSELSSLANDQRSRGIVTAWFASRGGPHASWGGDEEKQFHRWIEALHGARDLSADEADRWCWASYQCGLWDDARRFAALAPAGAPTSEWVRAMLLLRAGFVDEAARHLANATRALPRGEAVNPRDREPGLGESPWERAAGVQGALALRRDQFTDALRIFLRSGHWADAAFLAERILTLEELTAFVRAEEPAGSGPSAADPKWSDNETRAATAAGDLRWLLARRLVRANRFDQAGEFFPPSVLPDYERYRAAARAGFDETRPEAERGLALWSAAQILRERGMEILGTEVEPDYAIWDGEFEWPGSSQYRYADVVYDPYLPEHFYRRGGGPVPGILAPSDAEIARAYSHPLPEPRFHYRLRASELAWLAAGLLPNEDERTALILNTAGRWLAGHSPEQADLFYKSLVLRCPHTELGRKASAARWFSKDAPANAGAN